MQRAFLDEDFQPALEEGRRAMDSTYSAFADYVKPLTQGPNVGAVERWGSIAAGAALIAYSFARRSPGGAWLAAAGAPFVYRGVTGQCPVYSRFGIGSGARTDTRSALSGDRGIHVQELIRIERPVDEVYRFWRSLENLPRFMTNLESVTELPNGRSHWVAKAPAGASVSWDAEIINEVPNRVIGWRSLPDSDVVSAGSVNFEPAHGDRATQLTVRLQYAPPAGRAGAVVAKLFGKEPSQTIREDLRRLKQILEAGEIAQSGPRASWERSR